MKLLFPVLALCLISITPAFAELDLSNEKITSTDNNLILQFTDNTIKYSQTHMSITPHIEYGIVDLGNVELQLDDARVNVLGDSFTVKNDYITLYAKSLGDGKFSINTYINTNTGLQKNTFTANIITTKPTIITTPDPIIEEPVKEVYKPDLLLASSHDFRTFWQETFNIDVQAYDGRINPSATGFEGRIDGVDVKVLLSLDGNKIATLSGVTEYGEWVGEYFFAENISAPGQYAVDVILSYLGETVSKSSTMFVIGTVAGSDITNHRPAAFAGSDQTQPELTVVILDGSGSSDSDGDTLTYSWLQISGTPVVTLDDSTISQPRFTAPDLEDDPPVQGGGPEDNEDLIFELTVTDQPSIGTIKSSTDSVTITITFVS